MALSSGKGGEQQTLGALWSASSSLLGKIRGSERPYLKANKQESKQKHKVVANE